MRGLLRLNIHVAAELLQPLQPVQVCLSISFYSLLPSLYVSFLYSV